MRKLLSTVLLTAAAHLGVTAALASNSMIADVVYVNGKFLTLDTAKPLVEAVAVKNGRFIAVGEIDEVSVIDRNNGATGCRNYGATF